MQHGTNKDISGSGHGVPLGRAGLELHPAAADVPFMNTEIPETRET